MVDHSTRRRLPGQNVIACDRRQQYLRPPSVAEGLPEGHLAWFVVGAVSRMDRSPFYARYRADGWVRAAYDPAMVVALASQPPGFAESGYWVLTYARGHAPARTSRVALAESGRGPRGCRC
jgi:hypothetical protein